MNQQIRAEYIELIDEKGGHHPYVPTIEALQRAVDLGLSLVEIKFDYNKPVCKIMDYGKYQYEKSKQESANRKKQKKDVEKELQMTANTAQNDLERLIDKAREMLLEGNKVKMVLNFRGRTILYKDEGMKKMTFFIEQLADVSKVISPPAMEGKKSICKLAPLASVASTGQASGSNNSAANVVIDASSNNDAN